MKVMSAFINREDGANNREAQQVRKYTANVLNECSGYNKVNDIFKLQTEGGMIC